MAVFNGISAAFDELERNVVGDDPHVKTEAGTSTTGHEVCQLREAVCDGLAYRAMKVEKHVSGAKAFKDF
jgi:hypothetical protein